MLKKNVCFMDKPVRWARLNSGACEECIKIRNSCLLLTFSFKFLLDKSTKISYLAKVKFEKLLLTHLKKEGLCLR